MYRLVLLISACVHVFIEFSRHGRDNRRPPSLYIHTYTYTHIHLHMLDAQIHTNNDLKHNLTAFMYSALLAQVFGDFAWGDARELVYLAFWFIVC